MTLAELFRTSLAPAAAPQAFRNAASGDHVDCDERYRLRAEYIRRLAEFNEVAARHRIVVRAGMEGPAAQASWKAFQERCAESRAAWARYRKHLSSHACKHGALEAAA